MRRVSQIAIITLASVLAVPVAITTASLTASAQSTAHAAKAAPASITYHGTRGYSGRITARTHRASFSVSRPALDPPTVSSGDLQPLLQSSSDGTSVPSAPASPAPALRGKASTAGAVRAPSMRVARTAGILQNLDGLSSNDTANVNGGRVPTPPDQGLCVGRDNSIHGSPIAVWEAVNNVARETTQEGTRLRPDVNLTTLFSDPFNDGDVRCVWDRQSSSFIFTSIGFPLGTGPNASLTNTTLDVTVLNERGFASYQFDTSQGGLCLGDQPTTGFNLDSLVVSVNEFCGPQLNEFEGPLVLVLSMRDLLSQNSTVGSATVGPVLFLDPSHLAISFDPVYGTESGTEFLVSSFPFNSNGNRQTGNSLGLWTLANTRSATTGVGSPSLTGVVLASEAYPFPVRAASTGDGSLVRVVHTPRGDRFVISEKFLTANDSRMNTQIQELRLSGHVSFFGTLNTAVTPAGDTAVRDAAAWFHIDATDQTVVSQGYVASAGLNVLFPVAATARGTTAIAFTVTSSTVNPSSAFTTLGSGAITIAAAGSGPHLSFADGAPFFRARWGDYTAASVVTGGDGGIWFATEYVPPLADQALTDNWGTSVFEVSS